MNPIPVYLLTGCLGAGKTTALNHLLGQEALAARRCALLINEFGRLGVDGKLVERRGHPLVELNRGNLFCTCIQKDVFAAFERLAAVAPELVLVETTGLAEPGDIDRWFAAPPLQGRFAVAANLCLVDAFNFTKVMAFLPAAVDQVAAADALAINKSEMLSPEARPRLAAMLAEINPRAAQIVAPQAAVPWAFVTGLEHRPFAGEVHQPPRDVVAVSRQVARADEAALLRMIDELGPRLLRLKAGVDFGGGRMLVESVFGWTKARPLPADAPPTPLVAIGWKISEEDLHAALDRACGTA